MPHSKHSVKSLQSSIHNDPDVLVTVTKVATKGKNAGIPTLWLLIRNNFPGLIDFLLAKGLDLSAFKDYTDNEGRTALWWAFYHKNYKLAKLLVERGDDVNIRASGSRHADISIMSMAISNAQQLEGSSPGLIITLLNKCSNLKAIAKLKDQNGKTALWWAIKYNDQSLIKALIANGSDITDILALRDADGLNAMDFAIRDKNKELALLLINHGMEPQTKVTTEAEINFIKDVVITLHADLVYRNSTNGLSWMQCLPADVSNIIHTFVRVTKLKDLISVPDLRKINKEITKETLALAKSLGSESNSLIHLQAQAEYAASMLYSLVLYHYRKNTAHPVISKDKRTAIKPDFLHAFNKQVAAGTQFDKASRAKILAKAKNLPAEDSELSRETFLKLLA